VTVARGKSFTVAGGGPVGALLTIVLARHGYDVRLFEGRPDSRKTNIYQGKSINIALSDRGWTSLERIGIDPATKDEAIPMYRRTIHGTDGSLTHQQYGRYGDAIWSVSRGNINEQLLTLAEEEHNVEVNFEHKLVNVDFATASATFVTDGNPNIDVDSDYLFGADGAHSKVRRLAHDFPGFSHSQTHMPQSYIELNIPANVDGTHRIERNALHIWPRKDFMLIALPNPDGTFTCTLFLNSSGEPSFKSLSRRASVESFFQAEFPDAVEYLEDPVDVFLARTPAPLFLVQVYPWSFNNKVGLIGDAAHAIVPFFGQGMNCGFEDCAELNDLIAGNDHDWTRIFPAYEDCRKPNADAIAELSKRNFIEMSDLSGDAMFQIRKKIEARFHQAYPELWTPLYSLVTFSPDVPYATALKVGDEQNKIMDHIMCIPGIEQKWQDQDVIDELYKYVATKTGTQQ
jgi:kynurenine 3-monooxygenase